MHVVLQKHRPMKRSLYVTLVLLVSATSCRKQAEPADPLVGMWRVVQSGFDKDDDGTLTGSEIIFPKDSNDLEVYHFKADNTLDVLSQIKGQAQMHTGWEWVINSRRDSMGIRTTMEFRGTNWTSCRILSFEPLRFTMRTDYGLWVVFQRNI